MEPGSILEKPQIRLIRKNKGPVILYSDNISEAAKLWMILSEMGIKDLYILSGSTTEE
jgi:3-mercaptopyruvate sulfurtransferase SseA